VVNILVPGNISFQTIKPSTRGDLGQGVYLTRDRKIAENFADPAFRSSTLEAVGDGTFIDINTGIKTSFPKAGVRELSLSNANIKLLKEGEYSKLLAKFRDTKTNVLDVNADKKIQAQFRKEGFDGIELRGTPRGENDQILIDYGDKY